MTKYISSTTTTKFGLHIHLHGIIMVKKLLHKIVFWFLHECIPSCRGMMMLSYIWNKKGIAIFVLSLFQQQQMMECKKHIKLLDWITVLQIKQDTLLQWVIYQLHIILVRDGPLGKSSGGWPYSQKNSFTEIFKNSADDQAQKISFKVYKKFLQTIIPRKKYPTQKIF